MLEREHCERCGGYISTNQLGERSCIPCGHNPDARSEAQVSREMLANSVRADGARGRRPTLYGEDL